MVSLPVNLNLCLEELQQHQVLGMIDKIMRNNIMLCLLQWLKR